MNAPCPELKKVVIDNILRNGQDAIHKVMTDPKMSLIERHTIFNEIARVYWGAVKEEQPL